MNGRHGGRQPGAQNRRTRALQEEIERLGGDPLPVLVRVMNGEVVAGHAPTIDHVLTAARELRRLYWPTPVGRPTPLAMPADPDADLRPAIRAVLGAMAAGDLSPVEAESALRVIGLARAATAEESSRANAVDIDELLGGRLLR
jgi:hypothetical protein